MRSSFTTDLLGRWLWLPVKFVLFRTNTMFRLALLRLAARSTLSPKFGSPKFRHWRATIFAGFGLSSILFIIHGLILYGWEVQKDRMSLVWMGWMATANLLGAGIYAARVDKHCPIPRCSSSTDSFLDSRKMVAFHIRYLGC